MLLFNLSGSGILSAILSTYGLLFRFIWGLDTAIDFS